MPLPYTIGLWTVTLLSILLRLTLPGLPLRRHAVRTGPVDLTLLVLGMLGLVLHCTAMFARPLVDWIPGPAVDQIAQLGIASIIWYVVPALLVAVGLRRQRLAVQAVVAVLLLAVGITMYNSGPLAVHLAAIFALVVALAAVNATLIAPRRAPDREVPA